MSNIQKTKELIKISQNQLDHPKKTVFQLLEQMKPQFEMALGKMISGERFVRIAMSAIRQNEKLQNCSTPSLMGALLQSAQLGLEPNTPIGQSYLIPYGKECQFQISYKGMLELFYRHPNAKSFHAFIVYENDKFKYTLGLNPNIEHEPCLSEDRGEAIAYYAVAKLKNGGEGFAVMTKQDVIAHAKKYSQAFQKGWTSPWKTDFPQMALKTVSKKCLKFMPVSIELQRALTSDESVKDVPQKIEKDFDINLQPSKMHEGDFETVEFDGEEVDTKTGEVKVKKSKKKDVLFDEPKQKPMNVTMEAIQSEIEKIKSPIERDDFFVYLEKEFGFNSIDYLNKEQAEQALQKLCEVRSSF